MLSKKYVEQGSEKAINGNDIDIYFSGKKLYGDDFSEPEIADWFKDEEIGYFDLEDREADVTYGYSALNWAHGFKFISQRAFQRVLGVGSAYGHELHPILSNTASIVVLEPADGFHSGELNGVPIEYIKPLPNGALPFKDNEFDLITCFGVLHHIPNVSKVLDEIYRCLRPGGCVLIREPIISMGDWRYPRKGLTKRERGIPSIVFRNMIRDAGYIVKKETLCMFSLTARLRYLTGKSPYNSKIIVLLDKFLCALPIWLNVYHAHNFLQKLRPTSVFYYLEKSHDVNE